MQILSLIESNILSELLAEDMAFAIHDLITRNPRINEAKILGTITKSLPSTADFSQIQKQCIASIRWFVHNGDITNSGTRRYVMLPPYAILQRISADEFMIKICGDQRNDKVVENEMKKFNCHLKVTKLGWHWDSLEDHKSKNIGFRRTIVIPAVKCASVISQLNSLSVPVITPDEFREKLPSVKNVYVPPISWFSVRPPSWGSWFKYDSMTLSHNRWKLIENIFSASRGLYKWQPSNDFRGELNCRYFYHNLYENVAELISSSARLWMYYLDSQDNNPRDIWVSNKTIFVPFEIPEPHEHWLQLISQDWGRREFFKSYKLSENAQWVAEVLARTLSVKIRLGEPTE